MNGDHAEGVSIEHLATLLDDGFDLVYGERAPRGRLSEQAL